ncbi:hypothetical protein K466DRAFT_394683 [Polyporus arcularius HHB13444]|uniref:Uncharacterized protein n=1 Tax=Polyporus arcularius HHB13444 TaxID=1314778 RepID=A0A5C3PLS4_9APHY|nr:hypothetical protein K466DRAFT_394683 [Polyporus arcularius HHB13444]
MVCAAHNVAAKARFMPFGVRLVGAGQLFPVSLGEIVVDRIAFLPSYLSSQLKSSQFRDARDVARSYVWRISGDIRTYFLASRRVLLN